MTSILKNLFGKTEPESPLDEKKKKMKMEAIKNWIGNNLQSNFSHIFYLLFV